MGGEAAGRVPVGRFGGAEQVFDEGLQLISREWGHDQPTSYPSAQGEQGRFPESVREMSPTAQT